MALPPVAEPLTDTDELMEGEGEMEAVTLGDGVEQGEALRLPDTLKEVQLLGDELEHRETVLEDDTQSDALKLRLELGDCDKLAVIVALGDTDLLALVDGVFERLPEADLVCEREEVAVTLEDTLPLSLTLDETLPHAELLGDVLEHRETLGEGERLAVTDALEVTLPLPLADDEDDTL